MIKYIYVCVCVEFPNLILTIYIHNYDLEFPTHFIDEVIQPFRGIQATSKAFAAIRRDGTVATWGDPDAGGESGYVQEQPLGPSGRNPGGWSGNVGHGLFFSGFSP